MASESEERKTKKPIAFIPCTSFDYSGLIVDAHILRHCLMISVQQSKQLRMMLFGVAFRVDFLFCSLFLLFSLLLHTFSSFFLFFLPLLFLRHRFLYFTFHQPPSYSYNSALTCVSFSFVLHFSSLFFPFLSPLLFSPSLS